MQPKMTDDQKRELTLKIYRWMQETDPSFDNKEVCKYCDGSISDVPIRWFSPLDNRDDWALVEDEIERRTSADPDSKLFDQYLEKLAYIQESNHPPYGITLGQEWRLRRASPLVCAQALDQIQMLKEIEA